MYAHNQTSAKRIAEPERNCKRKIVRGINGKIIGEVRDGVYHKMISFKRHLLRCLNAVGIDSDIFKSNILPECYKISVQDSDTGKEYFVSTDGFRENAIERDYGAGCQVFLPLRFWQVQDARQLDPFSGVLQ